jgi:hypothetical protein
LEDLENSVKTIGADGDKQGEALMLLAIGEVANRLVKSLTAPDRRKSYEWSRRAADIFEEIGDLRFAGIAWLSVGLNSLSENASDLAAQSACRAMGFFTQIDEGGANVHALNLLSNAYLLRQNFAQAMAKASQGLDLAQSLNIREMVTMQLESMVFIEEFHDLVCSKDTEEHNLEGSWMRYTDAGEEPVLLIGRSLIWLNGDIPSQFSRMGGNRFSYIRRGNLITGELLVLEGNDAKLEWDNNETWILTRRRDGRAIFPEKHKITKPTKHNPRKPVSLLLEAFHAAGVHVSASSLTPYLDLPISKLGLTSTQMFVARALMSKHFGEELPIQMFMDLETIGDLVAFLAGYMNPTNDGNPSDDER